MTDEPAVAFEPALLAPGDLIGPYPIAEVIAPGATAITFRTSDAEGRPLALKLARPVALPASPEFLGPTRPILLATGSAGHWAVDPRLVLQVEAETLGRIRHPAFPRLLDVGEHEGLPYLVRAWAPGNTLRAWIELGKRPLSVLRAVTRALEELAEAGTLPSHGDLKPENIIVADEQHLQIIDPAAGMAVREPSGELRALLATRAYNLYLEPDDVTPLGVMLYELLAGRNPFLGMPDDAPRRPLSPELVEALEAETALGRGQALHYLPNLTPPPGMSPQNRLLAAAMRAIGLAFAPDGSIRQARRFQTLGEFSYELAMGMDLP